MTIMKIMLSPFVAVRMVVDTLLVGVCILVLVGAYYLGGYWRK